MPDEIIHKLIMPPPKNGYLKDLILCWNDPESPIRKEIPTHTRYSTNVNEVNCPACWKEWVKQ